MKKIISILVGLVLMSSVVWAEEYIRIGLNYPQTGPYAVQGLAQLRAAQMAIKEINASGGILGKSAALAVRDTGSIAHVAEKNVAELIEQEGCQMLFGGASSAVAIISGKAARQRKKIYFGTVTGATDTTGKQGHKYIFREWYNDWMIAKVLARYLNENFKDKRFFYIVSDYAWGWSNEAAIRRFTNTRGTNVHKRISVKFPDATISDFKKALMQAKIWKPDVLLLILFGNDMARASREAAMMGITRKMEVVVPIITLGMVKAASPKLMEGIVSTVPWSWKVPYMYHNKKGIEFVEKFAKMYGGYPSHSAATAYTILYQYKDAVERAGSFESKAVINALEGHEFKLLKDIQKWRDFDHQCLQTVYAVKCKTYKEVIKDKFKEDYFSIIYSVPGSESARTKEEWIAARRAAGKPLELEW